MSGNKSWVFETRKISHAKDMIPKDRAKNFPKLKINLKEEN